ncbi:ankyrin repeat domain-containing protein [Inquilinus sp. YAF38]|jgi:ankyrin repeat protein|uniref:ankyrin repeat domain-containing protein n=1 Tax=Inquilinus sp. YAF38 TaxID=3233084 RepID=UPI003F8F24AC
MRRGICAAAALLLTLSGPAVAEIDVLRRAPELIQAVDANDVDKVRTLLLSGTPPNATDLNGRTALVIAARDGRTALVRELLRFGAQPDLADSLGNTPLFWAADTGDAGIVRALLDGKANPNRPNREGLTPLMAAARGGSLPAVEALLAGGANPRLQDFTGRSALGWAQTSRSRSVASRLRKAGVSD